MARTADFFSQRTVFRRLDTPLREFLRTETGGAAVMLAAAVGALVWVNVDALVLRGAVGDRARDRRSAAAGSS